MREGEGGEGGLRRVHERNDAIEPHSHLPVHNTLTSPLSVQVHFDCLVYSEFPVPATPMSAETLAEAVAQVSAWRAADAASQAGAHGSVVVSGLFYWGDPAPASELIVEGRRFILAATGRAVGLCGGPLGHPRLVLPQVAFSMRSSVSGTEVGDKPYILCTNASPRSLIVMKGFTRPCAESTCTNLVLGRAPRCWLHCH